jgi:hypothetical protein
MNKKVIVFVLMFVLAFAVLVSAEVSKEKQYKNDYGKLTEENFNFKLEYVENIKSDKKLGNVFTNCYSHGKGRIEIKSKLCPELNKPAWVTLKDTGVPFYKASVFKNGKLYKTPLQFLGGTSYKFLANGFSEYTIADNDWNGTHTWTTVRNGNLEKESEYKLFMKMDEEAVGLNVIDNSVEENNGTITATIEWYPESPRNYSIRGDGTNGYLTTPLTADLTFNESNSEFTISTWYKKDGTVAYDWLYGQIATPTFGDGKSAILLAVWLNDDIKFSISNTTTNGEQDVITTTSNFLQEDNWHHIVGRMNSTHIELFVDGQSEGSRARTRSPHNAGTVYMGSGASIYYMFGAMDENKVYDFWMDNEQILELYENHTVIGDTPILHYEYDGTETTTITDETGNGHTGTISGNFETARGGIVKEQGSYFFNGEYTYMDIGTSPLFEATATKFTAGMWAYIDTESFDGTVQLLFDSGTGDPNINNGFYFGTDDRGGVNSPLNGIQFALKTTTGTVEAVKTDDNVFTADGWYHIIATYDGTDGKLYINGTESSNVYIDGSGDFIPNGVEDLYLGSLNDNTFHFNGTISEPFLIDRAISQAEVTAIYNNQQELYYLKEGVFSHSEINFTEFDQQIEMNVIHNISFGGTCTNILQVDYIVGECGTLTPPLETSVWDEATCSFQTPTNNQGNCTYFEITADSSETETFSLTNYTITSNRYYLPNTTDVQIGPAIVLKNQTIYGNATVELNDTDTFSAIFKWYVNNVLVKTEVDTGLTNGSLAESTLSGAFSKFDSVNFTVQGNNSFVLGPLEESGTIVITNANYSFNYFPTDLNLTIKKPRTRKFKIQDLIDIDSDVVWIIDGQTLDSSETFTFLSTDYDDYDQVELTANVTDGEFEHEIVWDIEILPADFNIVGSIAITMFILFVTGGLILLGLFKEFTRNPFSNLILKRSCYLLGIYLMMLNSSIMATIASQSGLQLTQEMFRYMWLFGILGYGFMVFVVIGTLIQVMKLWNDLQKEKRMG